MQTFPRIWSKFSLKNVNFLQMFRNLCKKKTEIAIKSLVHNRTHVFLIVRCLASFQFLESHTFLLVRRHRKVSLKEHYEIFKKARPQLEFFPQMLILFTRNLSIFRNKAIFKVSKRSEL